MTDFLEIVFLSLVFVLIGAAGYLFAGILFARNTNRNPWLGAVVGVLPTALPLYLLIQFKPAVDLIYPGIWGIVSLICFVWALLMPQRVEPEFAQETLPMPLPPGVAEQDNR